MLFTLIQLSMRNTKKNWMWQVGRKFKKNGKEFLITERWMGGCDLDTCGISIVDVKANVHYHNVSLERVGNVETYI